MQVPPVLIHFRLGFSMKPSNHPAIGATPMTQETSIHFNDPVAFPKPSSAYLNEPARGCNRLANIRLQHGQPSGKHNVWTSIDQDPRPEIWDFQKDFPQLRCLLEGRGYNSRGSINGDNTPKWVYTGKYYLPSGKLT